MFVIQHPRSNTNPTDKYRVSDNSDLMKVMNGVKYGYTFVVFDTYDEALKARDEANANRTHHI